MSAGAWPVLGDLPQGSLNEIWQQVALEPEQTVLVTANQRLPLVLRAAHAAQAQPGQVLGAPTILPWSAWQDALVDDALFSGAIAPDHLPPRVLSAFEEVALWERVIEWVVNDDAAGSAALMDCRSLAKAAQEARTRVLAWAVDVPPALATEEWRQFERWQARFEQECHRRQVMDSAQWQQCRVGWLEAGLFPAVRRLRRVVLCGFAELTPLDARWCMALQQAGVIVEVVQLATHAPDPARWQVLPCQDARTEAQAAARWAQRCLQAGQVVGAEVEAEALLTQPPAADPAVASSPLRLAIVVPDLQAQQEALQRELDLALHPELALSAESQVARRWNMSLGKPLAQWPLVRTALHWLALLARPDELALKTVFSVLRSPYWGDWAHEVDRRGELESTLRRQATGDWRWQTLQRLAEAHGVAWPACPPMPFRRADARRWAEWLPQALDACGWPGQRSLNSVEYQTRQAFLDCLALLGGLADVLPEMSFAEALRWLRRACQEQVFQPKAQGGLLGDAPVQVMGWLEAAGQPFDGVWLMGLSDDMLPAVPRPNPLIPAVIQRERGLPHASPHREHRYAQDMLSLLQQGAPQGVFSFPQVEGERELAPSPLVPGEQQVCWLEALPRQADPASRWLGQIPLETCLDDPGVPLSDALAARLRGGTQLLETQAKAPLAAYLRYRLGAKALETPRNGIDPRSAGQLLHWALQFFWQETQHQANLLALSAAEENNRLESSLDKAFFKLKTENFVELGPRLAGLERQRLLRLLENWLAGERLRTPFRVKQVEHHYTVQVDGLTVRLQIDRIDELLAGGLVIVDYKTGKVDPADWLSPRLLAPQMPLYALQQGMQGAAQEAGVVAVAYGVLRQPEPGFAGVAVDEDCLPACVVPGDEEYTVFADWAALEQHWQQGIQRLIAEIRRGEAANVAWVTLEQLRWLDAWPALRVLEWGEALDEGDDADE